MSCSMNNEQNCAFQEFSVWYIVPGLDIQPEQSKNDNPAHKKLLQVAKHYELYTVFLCILTRTHDLVDKVSRSESGYSGSIPSLALCWNSVPSLYHFAWHWDCRIDGFPTYSKSLHEFRIWKVSVPTVNQMKECSLNLVMKPFLCLDSWDSISLW